MSEEIRDFNPDMIIVGDLHLQERAEFNQPTASGLNTRLLDGLNILDQIIDLVDRYNIKYVIFTGDLFEQKDRLPNHILIRFSLAMSGIRGLGAKIIALRGNHDFKLPEWSTLDIFPEIMCVDSTRIVQLENLVNVTRDVAFIPFYRDQEEFKQQWFAIHKGPRPDILVFHNELPGAYYNDTIRVPGDWDLPLFNDTLYIGGHIHRPQTLNVFPEICSTINKMVPIHFIGVPYQLDFEETKYSESKGIFFYNSEVNDVRNFKLNYPSFVDLTYGSNSLLRPKGKYIRILGTVEPQDRQAVKDMREKLLDAGAKGVQIKVKYLTEYKARIKAEKTDKIAVLSQFVENTETSLDKERLINTGLNLLGMVK